MEKIIRSALIICRMNDADCEESKYEDSLRSPFLLPPYEQSTGRIKETKFFGRMA